MQDVSKFKIKKLCFSLKEMSFLVHVNFPLGSIVQD